MMKLWDIETSNQGGRGITNFVGTMNGWTHWGIHNHPGRTCTCVLIPLRNINWLSDFSVISKVWYSKKTVMQTIIYHYSTKDGKKSCSRVIKTQNNSRFSNSVTHTYIITIDYHYCMWMHYRKAKQWVSNHLTTNSRFNIKFYEIWIHKFKYTI